LPFYQFGSGKRYFKRNEVDFFLENCKTINTPPINDTVAANEKIRQLMAK
jgi:hypothetical protein